jgi:glucan phosphoethanolaminetransferase (alkaline phosphatase superfamily)
VDRIIREFENSEDPCFIFNVTMQNHSSYTSKYANFTPDIKVDGVDSFALSTYLSLMKLSDAALERLITYLSQVEEDTILVFFGDHQPADSVVEEIWRVNGVDPDNLTEEQECLRYQVPFVVWANYDIEEKSDVMTSANFLGAQVFDWCKIPMNGYQEYLLELSKEFSAITGRATVNKKGKFVNFNEVEDELNIYNMLQYYRLFG